MDLKGKNVVITGGSSGIGLETCKQLIISKISALAILDIIENREAINELKKINSMAKILFIRTDVTSKESVQKSFDKIISEFKTIDIVLCNAGKSGENQMELTMNVNYFGVVNVTLTAMPLMSKSNGKKGGTIMVTSSVVGLSSKFFGSPGYNASKHAVIGFYRALSHEFYYKKHNINFIIICPGITQTPLLDQACKEIFDVDSKEVALDIVKAYPFQSAETMGKLMIDAVKMGENGSVWLGDNGKLRKIELKEYWP